MMQQFFSQNLFAIKINKSQIRMNKPAYLGLAILKLCKTVMNEFQYDYVKPKYGEKATLHYMGKDSFII